MKLREQTHDCQSPTGLRLWLSECTLTEVKLWLEVLHQVVSCCTHVGRAADLVL